MKNKENNNINYNDFYYNTLHFKNQLFKVIISSIYL